MLGVRALGGQTFVRAKLLFRSAVIPRTELTPPCVVRALPPAFRGRDRNERVIARAGLYGALALGLFLGCDEPPEKAAVGKEPRSVATTSAPSASASSQASASVRVAGSAEPTTSASASASAAPSTSAGAEAPAVAGCETPAVQLAFTGPALLWTSGGEVRVVFDDVGAPRTVTPATAPTKGGRLVFDGEAKKATSPACVRAGERFVCADTSGSLHRSGEDGKDDKVIAKARPGAPISATSLGKHTIVGFLGDRKTTEGAVTLAFAALDDETPALLSEEGSGATYVALSTTGERVIAAYVDARRAMTPVHARELSIGPNNKLVFGKDAVAFIGEGADARTPCSLVKGPTGPLALLPIGDGSKFGMAAIKLGLTPADDAPTTWSAYPNGCTPAPLAATGELPAKVARVRPITRDPKSKRTLELGDLDAAGDFTPICTLWEAHTFRDVAVARDARDAIWISFTDGDGTWLVRRPGK
jgi:hypothetical protein